MMFFYLMSSFVFGAAIGSFCNVVIYRLRAGDSPLRGRSYCPHCKHQLSSNDLVPLFSYVILRGRCRYCKGSISAQYPLVELAMAIAAMALVLHFGIGLSTVLGIALTAFLLVIFVYDLRYQLILDRVSVPAMAIALLFSWSLGRPLLSSLVGGILGAGFFLLQYLASRGKWIGGGDIRLGAVLGLAVGWPLIAVNLVLAYLSGALIAIALIVFRRRTWSSMVPFGTFLSLSGFVTILWGTAMLEWYLRGGFFDWVVANILRYYNPT